MVDGLLAVGACVVAWQLWRVAARSAAEWGGLLWLLWWAAWFSCSVALWTFLLRLLYALRPVWEK